MFTIVVLVVILIGLVIAIVSFKKKLKVVSLSSKSPSPVQQPDNYKFKLLHYALSIDTAQDAYGIFQKKNEFYIVKANTSSVYNIKDIYPAFKGRPVGFVVFPQANGQDGTNSFIIFSSDGKVYNPFTISHPWRRDFFYLPAENPISIDGRGISGNITNGLFNENLLFRFYYTNYYIEEVGCALTGKNKSCTQNKVPFVHPPTSVNSYYQYDNILNCISSDGYIWTFTNNEWTQSLSWLRIFGNIILPESTPITSKDKLYLMGADYDNGVPVFLIYENGTRYLVDRSARKYDFTKACKSMGILPSENPIDFTKAGPGEFDYITLFSDRNIYGPTLQGFSKPVSDFEKVYPSITKDDVLVSISSVNKWQFTDQNSGTFKYYLVLLYNSGKWFEIRYDIATDKILDLGQTDQTSGLWTQWPHVKKALSSLSPNQTYKVSSYGWSVFVFDQTNSNNNMVYSINNPPESWMQMLYCTPTDDGKGFQTSSCVGLGSWKDYTWEGTGADSPVSYAGRITYQDYGTDVVSNPGTVTKKISLSDCISQNKGSPAIVYDENESDCHVYDSLFIKDSFKDPSKATFIDPAYDAAYQNRFCVKHVPSGKYLYWDFTDPNNQKLAMNDTCIYQNLVNLQDATTGDITNLQKSMGALWSTQGSQCLLNMNGAMGGFLQQDKSLNVKCNGGFTYTNGTFTNGSSCLHSDGNAISYGSGCTDNEWLITSIPCPPFTSTGYVLSFCER